MLPIQLSQFSALSSFSFLINLIAIPLFSWLVIPMTLLGALLLNIVEPVGVFLLAMSNNVLNIFFDNVNFLSMGYLLLSNITMTLILSFLLLIGLFLFIKLMRNYFEFNKKFTAVFVLFL